MDREMIKKMIEQYRSEKNDNAADYWQSALDVMIENGSEILLSFGY